MTTPHAALGFYLSGAVVFATGLQLGRPPEPRPVAPLERGRARGEIAPGVPRLDPGDPMANAALLMDALAQVPPASRSGELASDGRCDALPRSFYLRLGGVSSHVRFGARAVCQLQRLKRISAEQPGFGTRGLGEVAAFVLGRRAGGDVDVSRIVVPPFRFSRDTLTFLPADLGPLEPDEAFIGTYHTHPEGNLEEGVLSSTDLHFMRWGRVDFHGAVGALQGKHAGLEWLFDVVEPRDGDWNVFAHDEPRLFDLVDSCRRGGDCPLDDLRTVGSAHYLLTRYYEEGR